MTETHLFNNLILWHKNVFHFPFMIAHEYILANLLS